MAPPADPGAADGREAPAGPAAPNVEGDGPAVWLRESALALLVALVAVGIVGAGAWAEPGRAMFGDWEHPDMLSNHWVYGWVADQLSSGGTLLHNDAYYAPVGDAPFLAGNASGALLAAPFDWIFGRPLGINVYLAGVLVLNVLAGVWVSRAAGASRRAGLLGGVAFGVCPYVLTELSAGRLAQVPVWELAAGLALWIVALDRRSLGRAVAGGALIGLAGIEYFYYGLFAGFAAGIVWIARVVDVRSRGEGTGPLVALAAAGGGVAAVVVGPILVFFVRGWTDVVGAGEAAASFPHPFALQASLPWSWPLWSDVHTMVPSWISWMILGLAVWEARAARRGPRGWVVPALVGIAALGWALSLGPYLNTTQGPDDGSHLPYLWFYGAHPALQRFWWPYRHVVLVSLALAVLAARALDRVLDVLPPRAALVTLGLALAFVPLELRARGAPLLASTSRIVEPLPAYVTAMATLAEGDVLDLPVAGALRIGQQHLTLQALHHHTLLDGHAMWVDRVRPEAWDAWVARSSFLTELARFERGQAIPDDPARVDRFVYDPADISALRASGLRWIVVWDEMFAKDVDALPDHLRALLGALLDTPVIEADGFSVYDLAKHRGDGDEPAPDWDWPKDVELGDGSSRMTDDLPASTLVEDGVTR